MNPIDEVPAGPAARIYGEGWQSWSPTTWHRHGDRVHRPEEHWQHLMRFRPGVELGDGIQGEGLLVVDPGDGSAVRSYGTLDASSQVPTIRAHRRGGVIVVQADGPVQSWLTDAATAPETSGDEHTPGTPAGERALAEFGTRLGTAMGARTGTVPRVWCTWYQYFEEVTEANVLDNLKALDDYPVDVVQIDDGWSLGTGEWTTPNPRFGSLPRAIDAIHHSGRRAGVWLAPFTVGAGSDVAGQHPDWLVGPAGYNWGDNLCGLDLTHPGVREYLTEVLTGLKAMGVEYLKLDFLYAGAVPGNRYDPESGSVSAYRSGLALIREVVGDDVYLLGCGAPLLPSVGIVDAMRVSPDTFHEGGEDGSQGLRGSMSLRARRWQHDRLWTNDPDCLVARPGFALRDAWADVLLNAPGIRGFSDTVAELDRHGTELVQQLLKGVPA